MERSDSEQRKELILLRDTFRLKAEGWLKMRGRGRVGSEPGKGQHELRPGVGGNMGHSTNQRCYVWSSLEEEREGEMSLKIEERAKSRTP